VTLHPETWYSPLCYATNAKSRHLLDTTHQHDIFSVSSILDRASALESLYDLPTCRQIFGSHDFMEFNWPCSQPGSHCNIVHTGLNLTPHGTSSWSTTSGAGRQSGTAEFKTRIVFLAFSCSLQQVQIFKHHLCSGRTMPRPQSSTALSYGLSNGLTPELTRLENVVSASTLPISLKEA